jgi:hypothetical protein
MVTLFILLLIIAFASEVEAQKRTKKRVAAAKISKHLKDSLQAKRSLT